jgi:hypothetical protein
MVRAALRNVSDLHCGDGRRAVAPRRMTEKADGPLAWREQPGNCPEQAGFAGTVGPKYGDAFALSERKRDILYHRGRAVGCAETIDNKRQAHRAAPM